MQRKPSQFVPSQSLFPDTQQLIRDLGPSPPPLFIQKGQKWPRSPNFSSDSLTFKTTSSQNRQTRFLAPLSRSLAENRNFGATLDVMDPLSTSPVLKVQSSQKFQAPLRSSQSLFSQQVSTQHGQNKENYSFQKPASVVKKLSHADLDMIGNFLGQSNGMSKSQFSNQKFTSNAAQSLSKVSPLSKQTEEIVIPETPHHSRQFQSKTGHLSNVTNLDTNLKFAPSLKTPSRFNLPEHQTPGGTVVDGTQLRSVEEIPSKYQAIFDGISYFNIVQSKVFEDVLYTDKPLVVCAPTGSGKTMIFELAITRLLIKQDEINLAETNNKQTKPKVVYMAPIKALCTERHEDWMIKFSSAGLECQELTGDSDVDDFWQLQKADIILTTPEKWDSMTRRWRDNSSLVRRVQLFLIDEVHLLNDETRGATMEAVVSRMKTIQKSVTSSDNLRFVAVSATIPNTGDIAEWLGSSQNPAVKFDMDESYRPVTLRKVVLGYPWSSSGSEFKFDINLNYKLANVIQTYAENKPTLVFCSTRKGVEQAASTLSRDASFIMDSTHKQELTKVANLVRNHRLRELLVVGVGYHHAGLDSHDRHLVEEIFTKGDLLVLFSTSTLAMGVNLPAHLVIVKSTSHYVRGMFQEYTQTEMLQMIGRAGRPQFDTSATAVIMTREQSRNMYRDIVNGCQNIESSLHRHLIEHLNAEIVLTTIGDVTVALDWIRSTFLYIRILKNPTHYGYPSNVTRDDVDRRLRELCMHNLDLLTSLDLVSLDNDLRLSANEPGRLMARYCITFETMKRFSQLHGTETLDEMVTMLSECREFQEVTLRMNERSALNKLNKDKNRVTVRYPVNGKIKTTPMKVSCLLQATLGCISVQEFALQQDVTKIFRNAARVCRCLVELLSLKDHFVSIYNGAILSKCVKAKLWENSRYVTKQLPNIGPSLSTSLANAGVCSFERLESIDPREIEMIVNRNPPFGNHLREAVKRLPKYHVNMEQSKRYSANVCDVTIQVVMNNAVDLSEVSTAGRKHACLLLIGDSDNRVVLKQRLVDSTLMSSNGNSWQRTVTVRRAQNGDELVVKLISLEWVGLDIESTFTPYYLGARKMTATSQGPLNDVNKRNAPTPDSKVPNKKRRACRHTCHNKRLCAHDCCKIGISSQGKSTDLDSTTSKDQGDENWKPNVEHLQKYRFAPQQKTQQNIQTTNAQSTDLNSSRGWEMFDSFCRSHQNMDDDDDDDEIDSAPLKETKFQQQQNYYDDQINIGGRMKCSAVSSGDRNNWKHLPPDQRLWTMKGDSQDLDEEVDIAEIPPRPSKYGGVASNQTSISQKLSHKTNSASQLDTSGEAPPQLGRVFAWKTSTGQRSHVVTPASAKSNTQDHNRGTTCFSGGNPLFRDSVGKSFVANQVGNTASEGTNRSVNTAMVYSKGCGLGEAPSQQCFTRNSGEDRSASVARPAYMRGNVMGNTAVTPQSGYIPSHSTHQVASGSVERKVLAQSADQSSASNEYNNRIDLTRESSGINDSTNSQILPQEGSFESRSGADKVNSASVSHSIGLESSSKGFNSGRGDEFEQNSCESQWRITEMKTADEKSFGNTASAYENNSGNTSFARANKFGDTVSELKKNCVNTAEVCGDLKNIPGSTGQVMWQNNNAMKASKYHFKQCNNGTGYSRYIQDPCSSGNNFGNTASSSMWNKYEEPSVPQNARKMFLTNEQTNTGSTRLPAETRISIGEGKLSSENAKRVTFEDEVQQTIPLSDERDVSIRCDFDLSDDADDSLLMEACIQAEENMEMSEEIVQISSAPNTKSQVAQYRSQADKDIDDTSTPEGAPHSFNITDLTRKSRPHIGEIPRSRDAEKQMRARKADELAEAQRMFDFIFGAMF